MTYAQITSDNVRVLLARRGMSIRQLAEAVSLSPSTLTDALKSKKGLPIDQLMAVAGYFQLSLSALCTPGLGEQAEDAQNGELLAMRYLELDDYGKALVLLVAEKEAERCRAERAKDGADSGAV